MTVLWQHWIIFLVVALVAYAIGARKPNLIPYVGVA